MPQPSPPWPRSFLLLWTGETVSTAGTSMAAFGVPLLAVTVLRASTFVVAVLTAAAYLPWLVIGLPAGAWVDRLAPRRLPPRRLMIVCDLIAALLYASLPVAAWLGALTIAQVLGVALLAGTAGVFFATAYQVLLPSLVAPEQLVGGNARLQGGASAASIAGRGLAGLAAQAAGAAPALLGNAVSFLVSAACLLRIGLRIGAQQDTAPPVQRQKTRQETRQETRPKTSLLAETREGVRLVARDPYFGPLTLYAAVTNLAYTGNLALTVLFLLRVVRLGAAAASALTAVGAVGGLLGALLAPALARALGTARALIVAGLGAGLAGLLIPLTARGPLLACYLAGAALVSAGIAAANVIAGSFRQQYCPPAALGRVTAAMRFAALGLIPFGSLLAGWAGTDLGPRGGLWILQAIMAAASVLLLTPALRARRDLPAATPPADFRAGTY